ncbi:hypothetical protein FG152_17065 [Ochrobactrum sp. XJ1]|nr:hypothetical protein [Ochrobactrum sp. XJ1]
MNNNGSTFRRIGSKGLVIFERDGTLLRRNIPHRDIRLGDISNEFVQTLQQLRRMSVRFGFVSDGRGMNYGSHGKSEFAALTLRLDELLRIRGALPDFWMAWGIHPQPIEKSVRAEAKRRSRDMAGLIPGMILRAIEWYGVDHKETIFVNGTSESQLVISKTNPSGIQYSDEQSDTIFSGSKGTDRQSSSTSETIHAHDLIAEIERILAVRHLR